MLGFQTDKLNLYNATNETRAGDNAMFSTRFTVWRFILQ